MTFGKVGARTPIAPWFRYWDSCENCR